MDTRVLVRKGIALRCVCVCVCVRACVRACVFVCMCVCVCVCVWGGMHNCLCVYMRVYVQYICMYCDYVCACSYACGVRVLWVLNYCSPHQHMLCTCRVERHSSPGVPIYDVWQLPPQSW